MQLIFIPETTSLMDDMKQACYRSSTDNLIILHTDFQSAGRGQYDHHWESARGENLLMGIIIRHTQQIKAADQKLISDEIANSVSRTVKEILGETGKNVWIKPPNDIYVDALKIAGILIEHDIMNGLVIESRIGLGINVNQTLFTSDAPNPCSLSSLTGETYSKDKILDRFLSNLKESFIYPK